MLRKSLSVASTAQVYLVYTSNNYSSFFFFQKDNPLQVHVRSCHMLVTQMFLLKIVSEDRFHSLALQLYELLCGGHFERIAFGKKWTTNANVELSVTSHHHGVPNFPSLSLWPISAHDALNRPGKTRMLDVLESYLFTSKKDGYIWSSALANHCLIVSDCWTFIAWSHDTEVGRKSFIDCKHFL